MDEKNKIAQKFYVARLNFLVALQKFRVVDEKNVQEFLRASEKFYTSLENLLREVQKPDSVEPVEKNCGNCYWSSIHWSTSACASCEGFLEWLGGVSDGI